MSHDLSFHIDTYLKQLISSRLSNGSLRADQINIDNLLQESYASFDDNSIGKMLKQHSTLQSRRVRIVSILHRFYSLKEDTVTCDMLIRYLSEHRHARILSGICKYLSISDLALSKFINTRASTDLADFLQLAEEPDLLELEQLLPGL